ncbi:MAG: bifunctional 23S rRNA (guanine(2069)-N(7))-methyltransferase RlmK/23S rRNA (guanine(2445)-N(2))-methyltransferase RlmL, partial [Motiliproteus sp.]|nr:bifunctional 23S rRNA (guanine(2069)-N(7))-methyltransferase RlmK/23S rRNA (guanine(2445)-N(2))-methyltransferase RlmL [Motiliproteus sp.]
MSSSASSYLFFVTCPKGLEQLLTDELSHLGAVNAKSTVAGVQVEGTLEVIYRCCLWSRLANRVLLPLTNFEAETAEQLYAGVQSVRWLDHMRANATLAVDFNGSTRGINNTHFGALKVKDAIVDQIRDASGQRPSIDKQRPDLRVNAYLNRGRCELSLDLSGESLHRRGYRTQGGEAPLKENLAAALLIRSGWPKMAEEGRPLIDPMCGSGTLLSEAAMMAAKMAPGLGRKQFGFEGWLKHDSSLWMELLREARAVRQQVPEMKLPEIHGYDASPKAVSIAKDNIRRAGLEMHVRISQRELAELKPLTHRSDLPPGLLLTNPPYGERLSEIPLIVYLYRYLGEALKRDFLNWTAGVFTGNPDLGKAIAMRATKQYKLFNGAIPSKLLLFSVKPEYFYRDSKQAEAKASADSEKKASDLPQGGSEMFANRLRKNLKQIDKWARKADIQCYRVYDADMPEYALAVDRYADWVCVQEYAAPSTVDQVKAVERLEQAVAVIPNVMGVPSEKVVLKQRRRQSGKEQYQRLDEQQNYFQVGEGGCGFLVNLHDYLDTGLFLDHRPIRMKIQEWARDKRFLNLFCYTGAATIHAAKGGARSTTSVDMSNTYLDWLRKNLALNGFSEKLNETVQADCMAWLQQQKSQADYDLIFMDPPTFSNSKRMRDTLDIQRDHVDMIRNAMKLLAEEGTLVFSNNLRRFKMDKEALERFEIEDITRQTIDKDFSRNQRIHNCWLIR